MTKLLALSVLGLSLFSSIVRAEYNFVNCDSIRGTPHQMTLILANQNLLQIRIKTGTRARSLMATKLANQNVEGVTLFTVSGVVGLMEVDNQILAGNGGLVKFSNDEFSCL